MGLQLAGRRPKKVLFNGKRHREGTYLSSDKASTGGWFDDLQHGEGTLNRSDGTVVKGIWRNGKLLTVPVIPPKAGKPQLTWKQSAAVKEKKPQISFPPKSPGYPPLDFPPVATHTLRRNRLRARKAESEPPSGIAALNGTCSEPLHRFSRNEDGGSYPRNQRSFFQKVVWRGSKRLGRQPGGSGIIFRHLLDQWNRYHFRKENQGTLFR